MSDVRVWLESIGSMHLSGADVENLFSVVPEELREEVRSEWQRLAIAYEESKSRPIEEVKAEVMPMLQAYRIRSLYAQIDRLRAEVAALRTQLAACSGEAG